MVNLNYTCFRDVLNYIRKHLDMPTYADYPNSISVLDVCNAKELSHYTQTQIKYTISKLIEAGFIVCDTTDYRKSPANFQLINDITIKGYDFLTNATNEIVWKKTVLSTKPIGIISLNALCNLMNKIALNISLESMKRI